MRRHPRAVVVRVEGDKVRELQGDAVGVSEIVPRARVGMECPVVQLLRERDDVRIVPSGETAAQVLVQRAAEALDLGVVSEGGGGGLSDGDGGGGAGL